MEQFGGGSVVLEGGGADLGAGYKINGGVRAAEINDHKCACTTQERARLEHDCGVSVRENEILTMAGDNAILMKDR